MKTCRWLLDFLDSLFKMAKIDNYVLFSLFKLDDIPFNESDNGLSLSLHPITLEKVFALLSSSDEINTSSGSDFWVLVSTVSSLELPVDLSLFEGCAFTERCCMGVCCAQTDRGKPASEAKRHD